MTKRPAAADIDQHTFEYKEEAPKRNTIADPEQLANRKYDPLQQSLRRTEIKQTQKKEAKGDGVPEATEKVQKKSIFGDLFKNPPGIGLFSTVGPFAGTKNQPPVTGKDAPKIDLKSPNLFSGNGFNFQSGGVNLFSHLKSNDNNKSIFNFSQPTNIPPVKNGEEEEDGGDSADLQNAQEMNIDKSKSKGQYKYQQQVKVLFSGAVKKFKKNNGDLMENVEVLLQSDEKNNLVYLIVRLIATKNTIFTGYILNGSEVRVLNNKHQNIEVSSFILNKGKKAELNRIKLQLDSPENGKKLFAEIKQVIASQPSASKPTDENDKQSTNKKEEPKKQQPKSEEVKAQVKPAANSKE